MARRISVFLLCVILLAPQAHTQAPPQRASLPSAAIAQWLDAVAAKALDDAGTPGAVVVIVQNGAVIFSKGYGYADYAKKTPVDPDRTLFYLASVTKTFTATAVMQLVEQGKLQLDADVNTYLAKFKVPATFPQPITLRHLLTHTAGFDDKNIGYVARTAAEAKPLGDYLASDLPPRVRAPGLVTAYSNHGFGLAGHIVEIVSGKPYAQYVREEILRPLGMTRSTAEVPPPAELAIDLAPGHQWSREAQAPVAQPLGYRNLAPAGAISSSGADMARYMIAFLQQGRIGEARLVEEESARAMLGTQFTHHPELSGIGLAFYHWRHANLDVVEHGGAYLGYSCQLSLVPEHNIGIFVATNGGSAGVANTIVTEFLRNALPGEAKSRPRLAQRSPEFLSHFDALNGAYHITRYSRSTIEKIAIWDGQIRVTAFPDGRVVLAPRNRPAQTFYEVAPLVFENEKAERIAFVPDATHDISHFAMTLPTFHYPAAFEKLPWHEDLRVQLPLAFACLAIFASTFTLWPLAALLAMLYRRWRTRAGPVNRTPRMAITLAVLIGVCGVLFVAGLDALLGNSAYRNRLVYGMLPEMTAMMCIPLVQLGALGALILTLWRNWQIIRPPIRIYLSVVTVAATAFALFLFNLNLLHP